MTFGFEAGVGMFLALVLCGAILANIVEIGLLVLAVAGFLAFCAVRAFPPADVGPPPAWVGYSVVCGLLGYIALSLILWGLNAARAPYAAGRALRRLSLKGPRGVLPEQQRP